MILVSYSYRISVDYDFVKWLSQCTERGSIISKLLRINVNSCEHPKENVLILEEDFEKLCSEGIIKDKELIRGCLKPFNLKERLDGIVTNVEIDKMSVELKRLLMGVLLTSEVPFQSILLTINSSKTNYLSKYSEFLSKIKKFEVKDEQEGLIIIANLFKKFSLERESSR